MDSNQSPSPCSNSNTETQPGSKSLLASLWPFGSYIESNSNFKSEDTNTPEPEPEPEPEPYYTPKTTPTFKRLKNRLSGTREKQLIRAASRAFNDPPPKPGLGVCCGSSCDPCVNDLWREERDIWREMWGDRAVEREKGELEW